MTKPRCHFRRARFAIFSPKLRSAALCASSPVLYRRHSPGPSALINTSRREWLFLKMWKSRTRQFMPLYECFGMAAVLPHNAFVPLVRGDAYPNSAAEHVSLSPWAQALVWQKLHCGFPMFVSPLMKYAISSVPKLVTVLQVVKHGISLIHSDTTVPTFSHVATSGIHFHLMWGFLAMFMHFWGDQFVPRLWNLKM